MERLQQIINEFGFGISKEKLIEKAYRVLEAEGHEVYILNDKYIGIDGYEYQVIKSTKENRWVAKELMGNRWNSEKSCFEYTNKAM